MNSLFDLYPKLQGKISKALNEGYSEDEILGFLRQKEEEALNAGYSQDEIREFFGRPEPTEELRIRSLAAVEGLKRGIGKIHEGAESLIEHPKVKKHLESNVLAKVGEIVAQQPSNKLVLDALGSMLEKVSGKPAGSSGIREPLSGEQQAAVLKMIPGFVTFIPSILATLGEHALEEKKPYGPRGAFAPKPLSHKLIEQTTGVDVSKRGWPAQAAKSYAGAVSDEPLATGILTALIAEGGIRGLKSLKPSRVAKAQEPGVTITEGERPTVEDFVRKGIDLDREPAYKRWAPKEKTILEQPRPQIIPERPALGPGRVIVPKPPPSVFLPEGKTLTTPIPERKRLTAGKLQEPQEAPKAPPAVPEVPPEIPVPEPPSPAPTVEPKALVRSERSGRMDQSSAEAYLRFLEEQNRMLSKENKKLKFIDPQTDLLSKRGESLLLTKAIRIAQNLSERTKRDVSLTHYNLDLHGFKRINTEGGYELGDKIIKVVADKLREIGAGKSASVKARGFAAHKQGDEFTLTSRIPRERAEEIAAAIQKDINEAIEKALAGTNIKPPTVDISFTSVSPNLKEPAPIQAKRILIEGQRSIQKEQKRVYEMTGEVRRGSEETTPPALPKTEQKTVEEAQAPPKQIPQEEKLEAKPPTKEKIEETEDRVIDPREREEKQIPQITFEEKHLPEEARGAMLGLAKSLPRGTVELIRGIRRELEREIYKEKSVGAKHDKIIDQINEKKNLIEKLNKGKNKNRQEIETIEGEKRLLSSQLSDAREELRPIQNRIKLLEDQLSMLEEEGRSPDQQFLYSLRFSKKHSTPVGSIFSELRHFEPSVVQYYTNIFKSLYEKEMPFLPQEIKEKASLYLGRTYVGTEHVKFKTPVDFFEQAATSIDPILQLKTKHILALTDDSIGSYLTEQERAAYFNKIKKALPREEDLEKIISEAKEVAQKRKDETKKKEDLELQKKIEKEKAVGDKIEEALNNVRELSPTEFRLLTAPPSKVHSELTSLRNLEFSLQKGWIKKTDTGYELTRKYGEEREAAETFLTYQEGTVFPEPVKILHHEKTTTFKDIIKDVKKELETSKIPLFLENEPYINDNHFICKLSDAMAKKARELLHDEIAKQKQQKTFKSVNIFFKSWTRDSKAEPIGYMTNNKKTYIALLGENGRVEYARKEWFDFIMEQHPKAEIFIKNSENGGPISFWVGNERVGLIMPFTGKDLIFHPTIAQKIMNKIKSKLKEETGAITISRKTDLEKKISQKYKQYRKQASEKDTRVATESLSRMKPKTIETVLTEMAPSASSQSAKKAVASAIRSELYTPVEHSPNSVAAHAYLKSGNFKDYLEAMPNIGEITPREMRRQKGVADIRQSGQFVSTKFVKQFFMYEKGKKPVMIAKDIPASLRETMDISRIIERIDQGRIGGQAAQTILWPARDTIRARMLYEYQMKDKADKIAQKYKIRSARDEQLAWDILNGAKIDAPERIKGFAEEARKLLDEIWENQNAARERRKQRLIPYRKDYIPWAVRNKFMDHLLGIKTKPADIAEKPGIPDFIHPDKPFNPRELPREAAYERYIKDKRTLKLLSDTIELAAKDIFNTNIIHNNKIHARVLKKMGMPMAADAIMAWTTEAFANIPHAIDRLVSRLGAPVRTTMAFQKVLRDNLMRSVFPLNFTWNIGVQTTANIMLLPRVGVKNFIKGTSALWNRNLKNIIKNTYAHIVKSESNPEIAAFKATIKRFEKLDKPGKLQTLSDRLNFLTIAIEKACTDHSIAAGYFHGKELGLRGRALLEYASDVGARTQSMYNFEDLPGLLRSKNVKSSMPLQTFAFEAMNNIRDIMSAVGSFQNIGTGKKIAKLLELEAAIIATNALTNAVMGRDSWSPLSFIPFGAPVAALFGIEAKGVRYDAYKPVIAQFFSDFREGLRDIVFRGNYTAARKAAMRWLVPGGTSIERFLEGLEASQRGFVTDKAGKPLYPVRPDEDLKAALIGTQYTEGAEMRRKRREKTMLEKILGGKKPQEMQK